MNLSTSPEFNDSNAPSDNSPQPVSKGGCGFIFLFVLILALILILVWGSSLVTWFMEQAIFSGEIPMLPVYLPPLILAGTSFLVGLAALAAALFTKDKIRRAPFVAWAWASLLALLLLPSHLVFITDFQTAMLLKLGGLLLYLLVFTARRVLSKDTRRLMPGWQGSGAGLALVAAVGFPWVIGGALGSPMDTLLALLVSLLFGLSAALTLENVLFAITRSETLLNTGRIWLNALIGSAALGIMLFNLGQSGNQGLLLFTIPFAGLPLSLLSLFKNETENKNPLFAGAMLLSGLLFWPLAWIDPDELMAVITSGQGELMGTATLLATVTFLIILCGGLILLVLRRRQAAPRLATRLMAPLLWLALAAAYLLAGRTGFYGEKLFVILKDQPDVSGAASIGDYNQRRVYVYQNLVDEANKSQQPLRQALDQAHINYTPYYLVNALEVDGGPLVAWWLKNRPEVDRVLPSPHLRPLPQKPEVTRGNQSLNDDDDWNLKMIGAERVVNELHIDGSGILIGQSDSGMQGDHPELSAAYRGRNAGDDYNWLDPWNHSSRPQDIGGHGTHTLGSILGQHVGVAPGAEWIGCVNLARNLGNPALYLDCMQFMLAPYPQNGDAFKDGDPARGAMVLNNSWGCPDVEGCDANTLLPAVRALRAAGVFVVVSAGNSGMGGCDSVEDPPAIYEEVYSVGAVDKNGQRADFSSMGPVKVDGSGRTKPDLMAPGVDVFSSTPLNTYAIFSGTSMAGPHVAGVVALMWSANPRLIGDIDQTRAILNRTAQPYEGPVVPQCSSTDAMPGNVSGYGVVDAYAAVKAALEVK
ncbi:MAG: S8 family serine peptidase [Anaerolineae bacterium]|nr:S8 family serine peptidase [Anaerolineae bacterium]